MYKYYVPVSFTLVFILSTTIISIESSNLKTAPINNSTTCDSEKTIIEADDHLNKDFNASRGLDLDGVMQNCNNSYPIEMEYLTSLNESGSFPDETDKIPKCYIRCYLEEIGVMNDQGQMDTEQASLLLTGTRAGRPVTDLPEIITTCAERGETCLCERAYAFMRCVMEAELDRYPTEK